MRRSFPDCLFNCFAVTFLLVFAVAGITIAQPTYLNPDLPIDVRVDDLVNRMTLVEKISQTLNAAPAIERLGIPAYDWWNECLHGVARAGRATVFPQAIGLAATWDPDHLFRVATVISDEARAKHHEFVRQGNRRRYQGLTFWSPNINIFRDPRWGRGMETYGEDPYLTGKMGIAFIKGLQGDDPKYLKLVATVKHYAVHSGPEPDRHTFNVDVSDRDLYETYLPHFRTCIIDGGAYSAMGAYNRFRDESACAHKLLLEDILRGDWGFTGYVVSDCGAIRDIFANHKIVQTPEEAVALAVKRGCDLNCGNVYESLVGAAKQGLISEEEIDISVKRLFTTRMKLGMFDPPDRVRWAQIPYNVNDSPDHARLAEETARKSIILLKNADGILPLRKNLGTIAVIGPNADVVEVLLGNYNGTPSNPVTPLAGIRSKVGVSTTVLYARGCAVAENMQSYETIPDSMFFTTVNGVCRNGLTVEYFNNLDFTGDPVRTRVDANVDVKWWDGVPFPGLENDNFSVRWTGELIVPVTGKYVFSGFNLQITLDDQALNRSRFGGFGRTPSYVELESGKAYPIELEMNDRFGEANATLQWSMLGRDLEGEALEAARKADTVILVMGLSPRLEGEEMRVQVEGFSGGDRLTLDLPKLQENLMRKVTAIGKPTVLVLLNGSAVSVNWADANIPAIIEAWYPGQAAGTAIADVLFGDYNPAGRLPVTFYKSVDQLPPFDDYNMAGRTYKYFTGEPLYPFGHGLSYTTFAYSDFKVPATVAAGRSIGVSVTVANTGKCAGDEVVQLYVTDRETSVPVPIRKLVGFARISLADGESKTVSFTIDPRDLSVITNDTRRVIEPGVFELMVGGKQPGFTGTANTSTTGVVTRLFTVTGSPIELE
ncbi:glycoside hydrolase family 3 C-terminal domain-containing protein, partial [Candidatus Latescibacterota bacterium]